MRAFGTFVTALAGFAAAGALLAAPAGAGTPRFTRDFMPESCGGFSSTGANPFFPLAPGHELTLEGREDGALVRLVIAVRAETLVIDGIETRVVEEIETADGALVEIARNYLAVCNRTGSVFYFGEDVDFYRNGQVVSHAGSWRAGVAGARAGILMPGQPLLGSRYYQEIAPGVALDRAQIQSLTAAVTTPAGDFGRCLKTRETTPLEPGLVEFKLYAPGIGLVRDGILRLVSFTAL